MAYGDDAPPSRHRTRHDDAAPEPSPWHRYGDGLSAHPLYGAPPSAPAPSAPGPGAVDPAGPGAVGPGAVDPGAVGPGAVDPGAVDSDAPAGAPRVVVPSAEPAAAPEGPIRAPIGEPLDEAAAAAGRRTSRRAPPRAGRNLPAAIGVGLALAAVLIVSLVIWRPAFIGLLVIATGIGTWEMVRAVAARASPPLPPLVAGGSLMICLAWYGGADSLPLGLLATLVAVQVWRLGDGPAGHQRDVSAAVLIMVYVPFLAAFAALMARPIDGDLRVIITVTAVVLSDTGGYIFGVRFGEHLMAPSVSPKKSWEGFVGSMACGAIGCAVLVHVALGAEYWEGAIFGLAVSAAAVVGDLAESVLKRDLAIKDMSNLLPGHGGLMDRLDSILFALPIAYAVLAVVAPAAM